MHFNVTGGTRYLVYGIFKTPGINGPTLTSAAAQSMCGYATSGFRHFVYTNVYIILYGNI
jgi:hypothetical protein